MECIICDKENEATSVEHIVSESFGNQHYKMQKSKLCDECNAKFSKFENKTMTNTIFIMERSRLGVETKKGSPARGKIHGLEIQGSDNFNKNLINVKGLTLDKIENFDPNTQTFSLTIPTFDKSEVATSKLLLKTGIESIYTSQKQLYDKYDFCDLKKFLRAEENKSWPFINPSVDTYKFTSIATKYDKHMLNKCHCKLGYYELDADTLLFRFQFGDIFMIINLLNRKLDWTREYLQKGGTHILYPVEYQNKIINEK